MLFYIVPICVLVTLILLHLAAVEAAENRAYRLGYEQAVDDAVCVAVGVDPERAPGRCTRVVPRSLDEGWLFEAGERGEW
jgi:hypothetical protein